jgi:aspartokinase
MDARQCITDDNFMRAAAVRPDRCGHRRASSPRHPGKVPVFGDSLAGRGRITTTIAGGSDYSAALAGTALDAEDEIWTDR